MKEKTEKREIITFSVVKKAIASMKKRKAKDKRGWRAEWIMEGGDEMVKSLEIIYNRIEEETIVPKQWKEVVINSVNKNSSEDLSKSQRGLFLVNIVSNSVKSI